MMISGELTLPGDKSISHRALMLGAICAGTSEINNIGLGQDILSTARCLQQLGAEIQWNDRSVQITGGGWQEPQNPLDCGNSGTTARLLLGLLAGRQVDAKLIGDESLSRRPMSRVITPLRQMGAQITSAADHLPVTVKPSILEGICYSLPMASAQVKSAILFAGLGAEGQTTVRELLTSRNHTEIMLQQLGVPCVVQDGETVVSKPESDLTAFEMEIPGDVSTAAGFIAAATLVPGSQLTLKNLLANPTRTGFIQVLQYMGAQLIWNQQWTYSGEIAGDLFVKYGLLHGVSITAEEVPGLIDELPLLAVVATQAEGTTTVRGAAELRVKESDRIAMICSNLTRWGANITEYPDGFTIHGPTPLQGGEIITGGDHRIAMSFTIAGLISAVPVLLDDPSCIAISSPEFLHQLHDLQR